MDDLQTRVSDAVRGSFADADINVEVEGNRSMIVVTSDAFEGLNRVKRQQAVYAAINDFIQSGELHAVSIVARTTAES